MNGQESAIQSNTVEGDISFIADGAITEGYLVKSSTVASGEARVTLPTDVADECLYIALETAATGARVNCRPLSPHLNSRVIAGATIAAGVRVYLSGATFGKVVTSTGAGADTYFSPGIAEEEATAGGYIRIRPCPRVVVVT
jgi:hypothetical protein